MRSEKSLFSLSKRGKIEIKFFENLVSIRNHQNALVLR